MRTAIAKASASLPLSIQRKACTFTHSFPKCHDTTHRIASCSLARSESTILHHTNQPISRQNTISSLLSPHKYSLLHMHTSNLSSRGLAPQTHPFFQERGFWNIRAFPVPTKVHATCARVPKFPFNFPQIMCDKDVSKGTRSLYTRRHSAIYRVGFYL